MNKIFPNIFPGLKIVLTEGVGKRKKIEITVICSTFYCNIKLEYAVS